MKSFLQWQQPIDQTRHEPWPVYLGQWVVDALLLHQSNNLEIYYVFIIDCKMSVECLLCRCCAFLPRCMECRRGRWEFCPSVRPSVCLSNAWFVTKRKKDLLRFSLPYERSFSLVFWEEEWLVGATLSTWNFGSTDPRCSEIADFEPIFSRSASAVTRSEKEFN